MLPEAPAAPKTLRPSRALLDMIASWLRANFDLPAQGEPPHIALLPPAKLVALRYSRFTVQGERSLDGARPNASSSDTPGIYALYDDKRRTIYLREDWQGHSFTEVSVLVHEMVHHLQNLADMKFAVWRSGKGSPTRLRASGWQSSARTLAKSSASTYSP